MFLKCIVRDIRGTTEALSLFILQNHIVRQKLNAFKTALWKLQIAKLYSKQEREIET